jgi:4-hydroxy-tetrahydrodipicolinate reductase
MKILITGYGRMGREVEQICTQRGHEIIGRVDKGGFGDHISLSEDLLAQADGVVEFALADGFEENCRYYAQSGLPVVVGTTGWDDLKPKIKDLIEKNKGSFLYGSNFSIGAHIFFTLTERAAELIADIPDYDIMVTEYHHKMKKDSPSGTAITTGERILKGCPRKKTMQFEKLDRPIEEEELHVASVRGGHIPGIHRVYLDSPADTIEVSHSARNRSGFALGAVMALEWLQGKKGFFSVDDFIKDFFKL